MKSKMKKSKNVLFAMTAAAAVMSLTGCGAAPELAQEVYTVELGSEMSTDPADYITVEGADDKHTAEILEKIVVDVSSVDTEAIGEYEGSATYRKKTLKFKVKVEDTVAPVGELANEWADVVTGTEVIASDLVTGVEDKTDVSVQFVKNSLTEHIEESAISEDGETASDELSDVMTFDTAGDFDLTIRLTDTSGNSTDLLQKMHVAVPDTTAPEIKGAKNITISVGKTPDYLKGVTAEDETDGDLTEALSVDDSQVNLKKAGTYKVVYTCTDAAGNTAEKEITVTVKKKAEAKPKKNTNAATGEQAGAPENSGGSSGSGSSGSSSGGGSSNSGSNNGNSGGSGNLSSGNSGSDAGGSGSDSTPSDGEDNWNPPVTQLPPDFHFVTGPLEGELEIPPESSWYQK